VPVDDEGVRKKIREHSDDLRKVSEALGARWPPIVQAIERTPDPTVQFWRAKVLIGHVNKSQVWGYVQLRNSSGQTLLRYGQTGVYASPTMDPPWGTAYEPWYLSVSVVGEEQAMPKGDWKANVTTLARLAFLDAGYYDSIVYHGKIGRGTVAEILKKIRIHDHEELLARENSSSAMRGKRRARSETEEGSATPGPSRRRMTGLPACPDSEAHVSQSLPRSCTHTDHMKVYSDPFTARTPPPSSERSLREGKASTTVANLETNLEFEIRRNTKLREQNEAMTQENDGLKEENGRLKEEIDRLRTSKQQHGAKLDELNQRHQRLKEKLVKIPQEDKRRLEHNVKIFEKYLLDNSVRGWRELRESLQIDEEGKDIESRQGADVSGAGVEDKSAEE
jgi:hypothetical protein